MQRPRSPWLALLKWIIILGIAGAALMAATAVFVFWMYGRDPNLPDYARLSDYHPKQVTTITDANDRRIGVLSSERRTLVSYDKIPPIVVDSFVAAEDNSFWTHAGVDYWGMFRALVMNLRAGHTTQGASTITQQVVKNLLLTPERTFKRKIQEIILARRLEKSLSKEEIMALYLNQIYFGAGRYGVEEAARFYFGKEISRVNVGEAALLAALPKDPQPLSHALRDQNPQRARRAKDRQIYVLNQLAAMHKITDAEAQKWADQPIQIVKPTETNTAPEWVEFARRELLRQHGGDEAALDTLGATVRTTLDSSLQATAQRALQNGLRAFDKRHGIGRPERTVKADKVAGEVAKLAKKLPRGGPAPKESYDAVVTEVSDDDQEIAVDLGAFQAAIGLGGDDDARFNPPDGDGKTKKPSERFKVGDVVSVMLPPAVPKAADDDDDEQLRISAKKAPKHAKRRVVFSPGPEGAVVIVDVKTRKVRALVGGYASKVAGFNRATMAHRQPGSGFKPFVYAAAIDSGKYTPAKVVNDAPEVFDEFPQWKPKNFETGRFEGPVRLRYALAKSINTVSLRIAYDVKPENIVAVAKRMGIGSPLTPEMSIALGSNEVTPLELINAVATLAAGGVAAEPPFVEAVNGKPVGARPGEQVLRPEVAYVVTDMMRSVVTEGTAAAAQSLKIPIAGKTGTSNDAKDTWFLGLTPDYAICVWIGFDDNHSMGHETGGSNAVPVYVEIMKQLSPPAKSFTRPAHVVEATIDKATGLLAPDGAPKASAYTEVFVEGSQPTETAPMPDDVTEENKTKGEYED
ncbi:MAG TPA: PBP1A family penicillin-binding protein [Kofleriaceae bacterium]|nr:PBP1A family penicillin-binding protein [Kofleriaceae bacterium]